ncbi:MAG: hypothetical protein M0Z63_08430 [Actinomycetota bacterium]|nr:hypothetical protein [Actinomycetota bacterium]
MRTSFVLRLDPDALAAGRFSGEVEAVASGAVAALRTVDDLVTFCTDHVGDPGAHGVTSFGPSVGADGQRDGAGHGQQEGR